MIHRQFRLSVTVRFVSLWMGLPHTYIHTYIHTYSLTTHTPSHSPRPAVAAKRIVRACFFFIAIR